MVNTIDTIPALLEFFVVGPTPWLVSEAKLDEETKDLAKG